MARDVLGPMLDQVEKRSPALKDALVEARAGRYGAAAIEALGAGDQTAATFLKGVDLYAKGQLDQAVIQLALAAGPRRDFFPAAFFLGASLRLGRARSRRRGRVADVDGHRAAAGGVLRHGGRRAPARRDSRRGDRDPQAGLRRAARQRRDRAPSRHGLRDDVALRRGDAGARRLPGPAPHGPGAAAGGDREPVRAGAGRAGAVGGRRAPRCGATPAPTRGRRAPLVQKYLQSMQAK